MNLFLDLYLTFFRIGLLTFGGGYAMMPMFKKELVEKKHWCTDEDILDYYAIAQCTPGVIAVNTASFVGKKIKGVWGAICATLGVVSPSIVIITVIAAFIRHFADNPTLEHAFAGIRLAVCALVAVTVWKLLKKNVKDVFTAVLAVGAFGMTAVFHLSPLYAVFGSAFLGIAAVWLTNRKEKREGGQR